jgi:hypothetical protein
MQACRHTHAHTHTHTHTRTHFDEGASILDELVHGELGARVADDGALAGDVLVAVQGPGTMRVSFSFVPCPPPNSRHKHIGKSRGKGCHAPEDGIDLFLGEIARSAKDNNGDECLLLCGRLVILHAFLVLLRAILFANTVSTSRRYKMSMQREI